DFDRIKHVYDAFSTLVWTCRPRHSVVHVSRPPLCVALAIFRVVWEAEQAFPTAPQWWPSPGAPVVAKRSASCSPRDAAPLAPEAVSAPDDYARWRRAGSSVQIALGYAAWAVSTTSFASRSDTHVRANSAAGTPRPLLGCRSATG